jgi:chromosome segregation ATPase
MSLSAGTAQSREIGELRNHMKWLDEERRKSTRKMTELEQKLAQQGRELAERDQRIQELEWHIVNISERLNQLPDPNTNRIGSMEQQIIGLEGSVNDLSTQLRERTVSLAAESQANLNSLAGRFQEHIETQLSATQTHIEARLTSTQAEMEGRLTSTQSQVDSRIQELLDSRLDETREETLAPLRELVDGRLAEIEAKFEETSTLATRLQGEVEARLSETEKAFADHFQEQLNTLVANTETRITELEEGIGKMGNARELITLITRIEQDLEIREAEEIRLANLVETQETRLAPIASGYETIQVQAATLTDRLAEAEEIIAGLQQGIQDYNDNGKPLLLETNRRLLPLNERLNALNNNLLKVEAALQALSGDQAEMRDTIANLADEIRHTQGEVSTQFDAWQVSLDEHKDTVERFSQQWIGLSTQYKEARMAVQNLAHWQKQLEQQKREASEMLRVETNRLQSRWDGLLQEVQDKLKSFELDLGQKLQAYELENEQKWSAARRNEQLWREEISAVDELIQKLQQDNRNLLMRVQTAQANAIKKWPRLLMEEVEKVVDSNPSRRLQTTHTVSARSDLSVIEAIEQGLITVDYADDALDEDM